MVIYDDDNKEIWNGKQFIGYQETNNVAEYTALITGLECAARLSIERIQVKGDSKLVVKQVSGGWYCKAQHLRLLLQKVLDAKSKFKEFDISHVDRNENQRADQLANIAMDKRVTDLGSARYSFKTPTSSQEDGDDMQVCTSEQNQTNLISTFDNAAADEVLASLKLPPGSRMDSNTFEVLVNPSSFDDANFDAELSAFDMTPFSQKACGACVATQNEGLSNNFTVDYSFEDEMCEEELCLYLRSQEIIEHVEAEERSEDDPNLPFLVQFEIERLNLRNNLGIKEICNGKSMTEMITTIHSEVGESLMPSYYNFLDHCLTNGYKVDESNSCLFLFHAKVLPDGIELLPPEPADVMTRRIHRKYGSHRFLDLRFDEKCTETPPTFMKYFKQHFTSENKLQLAGRKWGVIYSNPSETPVILRLFAESGVGISKSDEMTAPQVAAHCIPRTVNPDMNPDLTLSQYMKRMQLNFTSTIPSFKLEAGMLVPIPEIFGGSNNENEMTDGCGLISREALNKVWSCWNANIEERVRTLGRNSTRATGGACPYSSFQGRIGGIKGMFVVDDSLDGLLVLYRPSQVSRRLRISVHHLQLRLISLSSSTIHQ
jgi:ribonuclease HI